MPIPALHTISLFVGPSTTVRAHSGTVDVELFGEWPNDAQLQFFALPGGADPAAQYSVLRDFFHSCVLACEGALADIQAQQTLALETGGSQPKGADHEGDAQIPGLPGLLQAGGMRLRDVPGGSHGG